MRYALASFICLVMLSGCAMVTANSKSQDAARSAETWYRTVYGEAFINGDADFFTRFYPSNFFYVTDGQAVNHNPESFEAWVNKNYVDPWLANGWTQTQLSSVTSRQVSEGLVIITARWLMADDQGNPVTDCASPGWHYVLAKTGSEWVVTTESEASCL